MPHPDEFEESAADGGEVDDDVNGDRPTQVPKEQASRVRQTDGRADRFDPISVAPPVDDRKKREEDALISRLGSLARVPTMRVEPETLNGTTMLGEDSVAILLERIDGISSIEMILEELPLPRGQALRILCTLRDEHVIELL